MSEPFCTLLKAFPIWCHNVSKSMKQEKDNNFNIAPCIFVDSPISVESWSRNNMFEEVLFVLKVPYKQNSTMLKLDATCSRFCFREKVPLTKFPLFFHWASVSAANSPGANCTSPLGGKLTSQRINPTGYLRIPWKPRGPLKFHENPYVPTWKFNIAGEIYHPQRKVVFQPSYFRGYVKLRGCNPWDESIR